MTRAQRVVQLIFARGSAMHLELLTLDQPNRLTQMLFKGYRVRKIETRYFEPNVEIKVHKSDVVLLVITILLYFFFVSISNKSGWI